jgi:DNA mismatch endonuclease (patch repair protein)
MPDNLTPEQRSYCMSRIKSRDTAPEKAVRSKLHAKGLRFRKHVRRIPGNPDIVFTRQRVAVFIDGDFWHGYRFSLWQHKIPIFWQEKIRRNRERDQANFRKLRREGWTVVRIWQHEISRDLNACVEKIVLAVRS